MAIAIVDYGGGNLGSVAKLLTEMGLSSIVATTPDQILSSDAVVLPGQGAIASAMETLKTSGMDDALRTYTAEQRPLLGICLGMQLLLDFSDEDGGCECLGIYRGVSRKFLPSDGAKVPHMGWNRLALANSNPDYKRYFEGIEMPAYAYFAHSYFGDEIDPDLVLTVTDHGRPFVSSIATGAVLGIQGHPEKSGEMGVRWVKNFFKLWGVL